MRPRLIRSVNIAVAVLSLFVASSAFAAGHLQGGRGLAHRQHHSRRHAPKGGARHLTGTVNQTAARSGYLLLGEDQVKTGSAALASGESEAFQFRARNTGATSVVHVYVGIRNTATTLVAGVYSSSGVSPGTLLTTGTLRAVRGGGWNTIPVSSTELLAGSNYWLAVLGSGGSLRIREREQGSCSAASTSLRSNALASTWHTSTYGRTCPVSAFVTGSPTVPLEEPPAEVPPVEEPPVEEPAPTPPPTNTSLPVITSAHLEGQTVEGTQGSWTGSPTAVSYQWQDCDAAGSSCQAIPAATASSHTLVAGDVGHTLRLLVTASNAGGSASASSAATPLVEAPPPPPPPAPVNVTPPTVEGLPLEGQTLSASTGTWTNSPSSFSYQWRLCDALGLSCQSIGGATSSTLGVSAADVGHTLQVLVTAENAGGASAAASPATLVVLGLPPIAPVNTTTPAITGVMVEGETVKASAGTWTGSPTSFAYEWQDCNSFGTSCAPIAGASASSYTLAGSDVGDTLRVQVTATNAGGSTAATSAHTGVVESAPPAAPVNLALPAVEGSSVEGQTLTATTGTWSESPASYAYQWQDCNSAGSSCVPIASATTSSYKLAGSDAGHTVRVRVTATNSGGSTAATSAQTGVVQVLAPLNSVLPSISGSAVEGQSLKAANGTWSGSPTSFSYQWQDCDSSGSSCSVIPGAASSSYTLAGSDAGHTIRVQITATNSGGSGNATSAQTAVVQILAPVNTALPSISGSAVEGQSLKAANGTWSGSPTSFSYQWQDCNSSGSSCVPIPGAVGSTYTLAGSDAGHTVRVQVTATNSGGSTAATSAQTGVVQVLAPLNSVLPSIGGSAVEGQSLKAANGTWSGSPTSFSYQWQDCDSSGSSCSVISGASGSSYTLAGSDAGHTIRVQVTATNSGGSGNATSAQTAVVQILAPVNTALPSISGSAVEGQSLKAANGTWSGSPTSFSYQWQDCNSSGSSCVPISGANSATYALAGSDVGHTVRIQVTATNSGGSSAATSAQTGVVAAKPSAPANIALPVISGAAVEGETLKATTGTWSGSPTSFAYQWQDCNAAGSSCAAISGAGASSYKLVAADVTHTLRVVVTATNEAGSTPASSAATGVVAPVEQGGSGELFISPSGKDSAVCSEVAPCLSMGHAFEKAVAGQTVRMLSGSYGAQTIQGAEKGAAHVVFAPASGASVKVTGTILVVGSHVSISGIGVQDVTVGNYDQTPGRPNPSDVSLLNLTGRNFQIDSAKNVTVEGGSWGPASACGGPVGGNNNSIREPIPGVAPENIVINNTVIHDVQSYNLIECHIEGLAIFAGNHVTVSNSKFYGNSIYDVFIQANSGGSPNNVTLRGNWMADAVDNSAANGHPVGYSNGIVFGSEISSNLSVIANHFNGVVNINDDGSISNYTGTSMQYNFGSMAYAGYPCGTALKGVAWTSNVWSNDKCGSSDVNLAGTLPYLNHNNDNTLNYTLTGTYTNWPTG